MNVIVRARSAVSTVFFVNGAVLASWVPHIPSIKAWHQISDGQLGIVLVSMAVGAVLALPMAGWLIGRFGSRTITTASALAFCLALPLPLASPNVPLLALSLAIFGACNACLDVSMNSQAVRVERTYGRPIMSSFHALFSLGGVAGAAIAGVAMAMGVGPLQHVAMTTFVSVAFMARALAELIPSSPGEEGGGPAFASPGGALAGLGLLAFAGLLAEGAMADWSALYLHDALSAGPAVAAAGFAAFSLAMAGGRLGGDAAVRRFGPGRVLRVSGAAAAAGLATALVIRQPLAAVAGFGLVGLGISNVIPIVFSAAGRLRGVQAGAALAAVATAGYAGFLSGPPVIGLDAELAGLPAALGIVCGACVIVALGGAVLRGPDQRHRPPTHGDGDETREATGEPALRQTEAVIRCVP